MLATALVVATASTTIAQSDRILSPNYFAEEVEDGAVDASTEEEFIPSFDPFGERAKRASYQPQPLLLPTLELQPTTPQPTSSDNLLPSGLSALAYERQRRASTVSGDIVFGEESKVRLTSDAGSLISKSPSALGTGVQRRSPIVNEPRVRSGRVGRLSASGSYWVPARIDLDTMVSKLDSRIVADAMVLKGPYSVLYGPSFAVLDIDLVDAPRYADGYEGHGATSADYLSNGQQFYGRQDLWGGGENWGYRFGYGHRTGNDYVSGSGFEMPSSFNSRNFDLAIGYDLDENRRVEVNVLRLDQTNVEFPGQAFDIDFLVTDAYEVEYVDLASPIADRLAIDAWYNRTRLAGSAQRPGKRQTFPFYDFINFVGNTDVDALSTGFSTKFTWGDEGEVQTTAGVDLRFLQQELNEITSGRLGFAIWGDRNSPIPDSYLIDPGLFLEQMRPLSEDLSIRAGARMDLASANITANPASLQALGTTTPPMTLPEILGSDQYAQNFSLGSAFITANYDINPCWNLSGGFGYAGRPPSLTELYAAQPFMFLMQNGLNTITGDPTLKPEQRYQIDLSLHYDDGPVRGGITGFHAWSVDYITYENLRVFIGPPAGEVEQVSLKFVNTDLATFTGGELFGEYDAAEMWTVFSTLQYTYARDRTRNGNFATLRGTPGSPSVQVPGLPRGFFSGVTGPADEPLPSISPLESRVGVRWHDVSPRPYWLVELSGRLVAAQNQVATSLLESTTPGFITCDLRSYYYYTEQLLLVAGVENFTNRNYREHLDFRAPNGNQMFQPGISFYAGAELSY